MGLEIGYLTSCLSILECEEVLVVNNTNKPNKREKDARVDIILSMASTYKRMSDERGVRLESIGKLMEYVIGDYLSVIVQNSDEMELPDAEREAIIAGIMDVCEIFDIDYRKYDVDGIL